MLFRSTYLGDIRNPLTLNRYSYCIGNPLFYVDPSGHHIDLPGTPSSNPASPYNRIDFETRDEGIEAIVVKVKKVGAEIKQGCTNFFSGCAAGQMEIDYMLDPVSKGEIEFAIIQKFEGADAESTSYAVGKNVSKCVYFLEISSALSVLAGGGGGSANSSGNIMLAGAGGEVYIVDGMESMPLYVSSGTTFTFFEEGNKSNIEEESKSDYWEDYYKEGRPEGGNPREDKLLRKETANIKSYAFKEFLEEKGETPSKWRKVMETWETLDGDIYERHYWTNGTNSYYHD